MQSQCAPLQDSAIMSAAACKTESIKDRRVGFRQCYTDHNNFSLCTARSHFKLHAGTRTVDIFVKYVGRTESHEQQFFVK